MTTTKNILKWVVYVGLLIIPFIPFIVPTSMFFPFISGKGFAFRILVEVIFGSFVLLAIMDTAYRPKMSWITKSVLLFTFIILLADLFGASTYKSLWSNYERMEGFVLLAHLLLYYFVVSSVLNTKKLWDNYLNIILCSSAIMSVYGLFQVFGLATINQGGVRVDGTFGNAAYLAIYLVFTIFISMYMMLDFAIPKWQKWTYGGLILLQIVILYFTATRGAILGLIGGLGVTALLVMWKERENKIVKNAFMYLLGVLAIVVICFFAFRKADFVKNNQVLSRFSTLSFSEFKTQGRYFVWPMALKGIAEKPVLGWGQENFNFVFNKYYNPQMFGQEEWFDRTHNVVLDWLIAGGVLGFGSYVLIYVALLYYIWRKSSTLKNSEKSILTGLIVAYVFHNMFVFDNLISYIMFFTILGYVHSHNEKTIKSEGAFYKTIYSADTVNYIALPVVVILTLGAVYFVNVPALLANTTLIQAMTPQKEGGIDKNLSLFKDTFNYSSFGNSEALEQLVTNSSMVIGAQSGPTDAQKQAFYDLSKVKLEEKIKQSPNDARYLVFAGSFFNHVGQYDEAIKYLEKAIELSPNKQTILFEIGSSYLGKKDFQKVSQYFKQAYDSKPESRESVILYAISSIYTQNNTVLKELSAKLDPLVIVSDNRFLSTYINIGDYNSALNIINARLQSDPKNKDTKLQLASVYATMGQKQNAITVLRSIIADDPTFKEQGEYYISQLSQ